MKCLEIEVIKKTVGCASLCSKSVVILFCSQHYHNHQSVETITLITHRKPIHTLLQKLHHNSTIDWFLCNISFLVVFLILFWCYSKGHLISERNFHASGQSMIYLEWSNVTISRSFFPKKYGNSLSNEMGNKVNTTCMLFIL